MAAPVEAAEIVGDGKMGSGGEVGEIELKQPNAPAIPVIQRRQKIGQKRPLEQAEVTPVGGERILGRDVLSRLIYGARNTIGIALLTTALSST